MDRVIDKKTIQSNRKKKLIRYAILIIVALVILVFFRSFSSKKIKKSEIIISTAERTSIMSTINTIGYIHPQFEEAIISPINTSVLKVNFVEGSPVKKGDTIMYLNKEVLENKILEQLNRIAIEKNKISKLGLELQKKQNIIEVENEVKNLQIKKLLSDKKNAQKLYEIGGGTQGKVQKIESELKILKLKKKELEYNLKNTKSTQYISLDEAKLSLEIHKQSLQILEEKLKKSLVIAPRDGVLTFIENSIGEKINDGDILAKIADLNTYLAKATISDIYAEKILSGTEIYLQINKERMYGQISSVNPEINNNEISFNIRLDNSSHHLFKPKMQVDVSIITKRNDNTIRVTNGNAFIGLKAGEVFVLEGMDIAKKKKIKIGIQNKNYVEILEGIEEGDKVIVSGAELFKSKKEILIID